MNAKHCLRCGAALVGKDDGGRARLGCPADGCGYVFYDNPLPVVAALVEHEQGVLLVRGVGWPEKLFGLVTGFLERGETPEQGVLREVREETTLDGELVGPIGTYAFLPRNELILAYHVRARGEVRLSDELTAYKLIDPAKLRPWPFGTGEAVRDWLARRAAGSSRSSG